MSAWGDLGGSRNKRALLRFAGEEASNEFDRHLNRYYARLKPFFMGSEMGQNAAAASGSMGLTSLANLNQTRMQGAGLQANAYARQGKFWEDMASTGMGFAGLSGWGEGNKLGGGGGSAYLTADDMTGGI
jgi:hypothetical protein